MAQFDLYSNANHATKAIYPYLLDVQSPLLDSLDTSVTVGIKIPEMVGINFPVSCP